MEMTSKQTKLIREAAEWRLIGLMFECPNDGWKVQVKDLAKELRDSKLKTAAEFACIEASEGLYHSIFGPGGPAPPREVTYRSWVQPGYLLSELSTYYDAFSYRPKSFETPDHISVETGFIAFLKLKEAFALSCGEKDNAKIAAKASEDFIREHLSKFVQPLTKSLSCSSVEYLALASAALLKRVGTDKDRKVRQILPVLGDWEDSMFECG